MARKKEIDVVIRGGGPDIPALAQGLKRLDQDFKIRRIAGTSAGAILASLYAAGYSTDEIVDITLNTNFKKFVDYGFIPFSTIYRLICKRGLCKGKTFFEFMSKKMIDKGITYFGDLTRVDDCRVFATRIEDGKTLEYSKEHTPNDTIASSVRASISIPIFFESIKDGVYNLGDGGIRYNYPIDTFDDHKRPTYGLMLKSKNISELKPLNGFFTIFKIIAKLPDIWMDTIENLHMSDAHWAKTITLFIDRVGLTNFSISDEQKRELIEDANKSYDEYFQNN